MSATIKNMQHIGGWWWRCLRCGGTVQAACECCEPNPCNCQRTPTKEGK